MTVPMIKSIGDVPYPIDTHSDVLSPLLTAGAALGITGEATDSAAWLQRVSTSDGPTTAKSIHGNTVVQDGSLLPVRMEGVETVGFNQWDGEIEQGIIDGVTGLPSLSGYAEYRRSKNYVPVFPDTEYYFKSPSTLIYVVFYDADKNPIRHTDSSYQYNLQNTVLRTPENAHYMRFNGQANQLTFNTDVCINISGPRNGEYEPYWQQTRTIPASTYFPQGMRSAGSVYDELTSTEAITRVAQYTFTGTEGITFNVQPAPSGTENLYIAICNVAAFVSQTGMPAPKLFAASSAEYHWKNIECDKLPVQNGAAYRQWTSQAVGLYPDSSAAFIFGVLNASTSAEVNDWLAANRPTVCYEVDGPTTQPIDPALNLSYRVDDFGTERVMVPTGENSAPPTIVAAQGYTAESLRDAALATIAPVENGTASTNYGIGSYLVHGGQLCRVTTAIATGESISIGTNVTATTVMAEVIALIAQ